MFAESRQFIERNRRPIFGVVYSDNDYFSMESKNLACYIGAQLGMTGYANVIMIGMSPDGGPGSAPLTNNKRLSFSPSGGKKALELPASDIQYSDLSAIETCHILIVCVNSEDSNTCHAKLSEILDPKRPIYHEIGPVTIFNMHLGGKIEVELNHVSSSESSFGRIRLMLIIRSYLEF